MGNTFNNDKERIDELKSTLEEAFKILDVKGEEGADIVRTLIRDTLSRYKENKKFVTAETKTEIVSGLKLDILKD